MAMNFFLRNNEKVTVVYLLPPISSQTFVPMAEFFPFGQQIYQTNLCHGLILFKSSISIEPRGCLTMTGDQFSKLWRGHGPSSPWNMVHGGEAAVVEGSTRSNDWLLDSFSDCSIPKNGEHCKWSYWKPSVKRGDETKMSFSQSPPT